MTEVDKIVNGYHIIENKAQFKPKNYQSFIPQWIKNPIRDIASESSELDPKLLNNLKESGFKELLPIQKISVSHILSQYEASFRECPRPRDVCISAPTGQGKTLCFLIPAINLLINRNIPAIRALIVVPVKDLAKQIYEITQNLVKGTTLRTSLVVGGDRSYAEEMEDLIFHHQGANYMADIVICTPGRLVDHIFNNPHFNLDHLRLLIVDEADRLVRDEHQDWYTVLENHLYFSKTSLKKLPNTSLDYSLNTGGDLPLQKILSSATLLHNPALLKKFNLHLPLLITSEKIKNKNNLMKADEDEEQNNVNMSQKPEKLKEFTLVTSAKDKLVQFLALVHKNLSDERILVFIKSKDQAENLCKFLENCSPRVNAKLICGSYNLKRRQKYLDAFKKGESPILLCTDAMARGIDIENVTTVINLDFPPSPIVYIHRSGRTARFDKEGRVVTFLDRTQVIHFKKLLKAANRSEISELKISNKEKKIFFPVFNAAMRRVNLAEPSKESPLKGKDSPKKEKNKFKKEKMEE